MHPLQLLNLVVMCLFELIDTVSAVAAQSLHRVNNISEVSKQVGFFLESVSVRREYDCIATITLPSAPESRRETSPPSLDLTSLYSFLVGGMFLVRKFVFGRADGRKKRSE
jgi:hypothetical protein